MQTISQNLEKLYEEVIEINPSYIKLIEDLSDGIVSSDYPNVLLYGCEGFDHTALWDAAMCRRHGKFQRRTCVWNKQWIYSETPYFFEIDFAHPNQPKDLMSLSEFMKEILRHPCIHAERHIFVLKHIDLLCTRGFVYMLRVLLERFAKNVWFVCTTHHISSIESPIRSRFLCIRIPLPSQEDMANVLHKLQLSLPQECNEYNVVNMNVATFLSMYHDKDLPYPVGDFCKFHAPFIQDVINMTSPSILQIRSLTQKLSVHGFTLSQIAQDLLHFIKPKDKHNFIVKAREIDELFCSTEKYRKPLYIELLLHTAIYGFTINKK